MVRNKSGIKKKQTQKTKTAHTSHYKHENLRQEEKIPDKYQGAIISIMGWVGERVGKQG